MAVQFGTLQASAFDEFGLGIVTIGASAMVAAASLLAISLSRYSNRRQQQQMQQPYRGRR